MKEKFSLSRKAMPYEYISNQIAEELYANYVQLCAGNTIVGSIIGGKTFEQWLDAMEYKIY